MVVSSLQLQNHLRYFHETLHNCNEASRDYIQRVRIVFLDYIFWSPGHLKIEFRPLNTNVKQHVRYWSKVSVCTIPCQVSDLEVKVMDLEFFCFMLILRDNV